jgi:hypothetical protein
MASEARTAIVSSVATTIATIVGMAILAVATGAWASKADKSDIVAVRAEFQRLEDIVCLDHPKAPLCAHPERAP